MKYTKFFLILGGLFLVVSTSVYAFSFFSSDKDKKETNDNLVKNMNEEIKNDLTDEEQIAIDKKHGIFDFESCAKVAKVVMKSLPAKCRSPFSGRIYTDDKKAKSIIQYDDGEGCSCEDDIPTCEVKCDD